VEPLADAGCVALAVELLDHADPQALTPRRAELGGGDDVGTGASMEVESTDRGRRCRVQQGRVEDGAGARAALVEAGEKAIRPYRDTPP